MKTKNANVKNTGNKTVMEAWNPPISWIRQKIELAGNLIGSVHFYKRSDNSFRKMSYRLHVKNPSTAKAPKSPKFPKEKNYKNNLRKDIDNKNNQMTVLDANKVVKDIDGKIIGRGAYRCIPLENVVRISNNGCLYIIHQEF
jgi:hypothetical protein